MAQEYTITQVSPQEPRTWQGPGGLIYYIVVKVEGHQKPIEVGKKAANALKPGDTIYGDINPGQYETDKFKPAQKPQFGGQQSFGNAPANKPAYGQKTEEQQESIARSVALKAAVDFWSMYPEDNNTEAVMVTQVADVFLAWLTKSSEPQKASVAQSSERDPVTTYQEIVDGEQYEGDPSEIPFN